MQSAAMALGFGANYQYGKRKISAMGNDAFNNLSVLELNENLISEINSMIPSTEKSFGQMEKMNEMILLAMSRYFDQAVGFLGQWIQQRGVNLQHNIENALPSQQELVDALVPPEFQAGGEHGPLEESNVENPPPAADAPSLQEINLKKYQADILKYNFSKYSRQQHLTNYPLLPGIIQNSRRKRFDVYMLSIDPHKPKISRAHQLMLDRAIKYRKLVDLYSQKATNNRNEKRRIEALLFKGLDRRNNIRLIANLDQEYVRLQKKRADAQAILNSANNQIKNYEKQRR